jgi:hypothetical protein
MFKSLRTVSPKLSSSAELRSAAKLHLKTVPMTDSEALFQLVRQKKECLEKLHACSGNQLRYVEQENIEALLEVLAFKQRLLIEIEGIDGQIKTYHVDDPEQRVWPSQQMREACRETAAECDRLVRETLDNDRVVEQLLIEKKKTAKEQLQQFDNKGRIQNAYQQQKKPPRSTGHTHCDLGAG